MPTLHIQLIRWRDDFVAIVHCGEFQPICHSCSPRWWIDEAWAPCSEGLRPVSRIAFDLGKRRRIAVERRTGSSPCDELGDEPVPDRKIGFAASGADVFLFSASAARHIGQPRSTRTESTNLRALNAAAAVVEPQ